MGIAKSVIYYTISEINDDRWTPYAMAAAETTTQWWVGVICRRYVRWIRHITIDCTPLRGGRRRRHGYGSWLFRVVNEVVGRVNFILVSCDMMWRHFVSYLNFGMRLVQLWEQNRNCVLGRKCHSSFVAAFKCVSGFEMRIFCMSRYILYHYRYTKLTLSTGFPTFCMYEFDVIGLQSKNSN